MSKAKHDQIKPFANNPRKISNDDLMELQTWLREFGDMSGVVHDLNSNEIVGGNQRSKAIDINACEIVIEHKNGKPDSQGTVGIGYVIWEGNRYNYRQVRWTKDQCLKANIIANKAGGGWDWEVLNSQFDSSLLESLGFDEGFKAEMEEGLAGMASLLPQEPQGQEITKELSPLKMVRALVSFPIDLSVEIAEMLEQIQSLPGVEVDYGAN